MGEANFYYFTCLKNLTRLFNCSGKNMSVNENQAEEIEVLDSIYDGDESFKKLNDTTYQYMITHPSNENKNFLLEIAWGDQYPDELPDVNLNAFFNKHIAEKVKEEIRDSLLKQADDLVGCAMTHTLIEYARENVEELTENQPDKPESTFNGSVIATTKGNDEEDEKEKSAERDDDTNKNLTKAQKRRMWDRMEAGAKAGEKPRGWNWMDIIKHLSQTGCKDDG